MKKRIAYITDLHLDEQFVKDHGVDARHNWDIILRDVEGKKIDEIIFGGDIGAKDANAWFFSTLAKYPLSVTLGNHDAFEEAAKYFSKGIENPVNELYYASEDDHYKYIFLDTSKEIISQHQLDWLPGELDSAKHILLFVHHPVLSVDSEMDRVYPLKDREKLEILLLESKKRITIFCGHYHFEDCSQLENITQFITPSASIQVEKIIGEIRFNPNTFGYRIIELTNDDLNTELILFDKN